MGALAPGKIKHMAKKKKTAPLFGIAMFLIFASLAAAGTFGYLYFRGTNDLEASAKKLTETQTKHDQLLSSVSDLQSRLSMAEERGRQLEATGREKEDKAYSLLSERCDSGNCVLSSSRDKVFGLVTVKGYYRRIDIPVGDGQIDVCPGFIITEGDNVLMEKMRTDVGSWYQKIEGVEKTTVIVGYGNLSNADKSAIKSSTENDQIMVEAFIQEIPEGIGSEEESCFSPWRILAVR